jgi:hypothetical protein
MADFTHISETIVILPYLARRVAERESADPEVERLLSSFRKLDGEIKTQNRPHREIRDFEIFLDDFVKRQGKRRKI